MGLLYLYLYWLPISSCQRRVLGLLGGREEARSSEGQCTLYYQYADYPVCGLSVRDCKLLMTEDEGGQ